MPHTEPASAAERTRLSRWQLTTGLSLLVGYSGYYICRSNLSVAGPLMMAAGTGSLDRATIGLLSSAGVLAYAAGKSLTGVAGDFLGGRALFLGGLFLSVLATLGFAVSSTVPLLLGFWVCNRFVQSAGWGGLTKMAAHWFPARRYGTVMSVLSLSFLFGDAVGRYVLGLMLSNGTSWRGLFVGAAGILGVIGLIDLLLLNDSPRDLGLPEPSVSASNLFGADGAGSTPSSLGDLLRPYATSLSFWLVCALSLGMTLVREGLNTWIPTYLVDVHHLTPGDAARYSALFPFVGGVSALLVGVMTDRVATSQRVGLIVPAMALSAVSLAVLASGAEPGPLWLSLAALAAASLGLLGPYTMLAGAMAVEMGGRRGSATAAGLIDTAGYIGGALSGSLFATLATESGWSAVFGAMALVSAAVAIVGASYAGLHWVRSAARVPQPDCP